MSVLEGSTGGDSILDRAGVATAVLGPDLRVRRANRAFADLAGVAGTVAGVALADSAILVADAVRDRVRALFDGVGGGADTLWLDLVGRPRSTRESRDRPTHWRACFLLVSGPDPVVHLVATERTADQRHVEHLQHRVAHDGLTGLLNRAGLLETLEAATARAVLAGGHCGVLFLDLDGFKAVNDRVGHRAGDEVLVVVAERLRAAVRATDRVGRVGGDEFAVVCEPVSGIAELDAVAERIGSELGSVAVPGTGLGVRVSVGAALLGGPTAPLDLLDAADQAMRVVRQGRSHRGPVPRMAPIGEDGQLVIDGLADLAGGSADAIVRARAVGVLMARHTCGPAAAAALLERVALSSGRTTSAVANELAGGTWVAESPADATGDDHASAGGPR